MTKVRQDPDARLDWQVDWSGYLQEGETIESSDWQLDGPPDSALVIGTGMFAHSSTPTTATVWLSGGTVDRSYPVRNRITTSQGRVDDETLLVFIAQN